ncbi:hypothetical protein NPIL_381341 [Nephila pilipes]|uniref:Uncharacterized protein n=1 Tax=Nephila pilipes TaxID=299642 RepID=A0A8X6QDR8_NEPPI|nr:hypothetical protein NPIL_381341 [Nephila pilipes]
MKKQKQHPEMVAPVQQQGRQTAFETLACEVGLLLEDGHLQTGIISVLGGEKFHCLSLFWLVGQHYLFQEISLLFWLEANEGDVYLCPPREQHLQLIIFEARLSSEHAVVIVRGIHSGICCVDCL